MDTEHFSQLCFVFQVLCLSEFICEVSRFFFFDLRLCMYEISFCNVTDKFVTAECLFSDPSLVSTKGDK